MKLRNALVLFVALTATQDQSGWWTLAYEGELKGRGSALTREHFDQVIANFKRYGRPVPVTLYHADIDAASHPEKCKAHAWLDELRVGSMEVGGKTVATLEGKRRWVIESTKADVACGAIVGGSVTIFFNWKDDATAENLGAYLYSFSLTNNPALTHLPALAASQRPAALGHWYGDIEKRDDVLAMLRQVLDLPVMTDEAGTLAELAKLERLVSDPTVATGVDVDDILCALREALRLPALSTAAEVIAAVRQALATLPASAPTAMSRRLGADVTPTETTMSMIALAALIGVAAKSEDEAKVALEARLKENGTLRRALNLGADASPADVAAALSKLTTDAARVPGLVQELDAFKKREAAALEVQRKGWIDDVMAAQGLPETVRPSLELHAATDWPSFQKAHPRPSREELAQRAQDGDRLGRAALGARKPSAPAPTTGEGTDEPGADDLDAAAQALMQEHNIGYAEALDMLAGG